MSDPTIAPSLPDRGQPRDFRGYGRNPPDPKWPGGARIAVNFNLNVEAGGEHCLLEGDGRSEDALNDIGLPSYSGVRSPVVESAFEYGSSNMPARNSARKNCAPSIASIDASEILPAFT